MAPDTEFIDGDGEGLKSSPSSSKSVSSSSSSRGSFTRARCCQTSSWSCWSSCDSAWCAPSSDSTSSKKDAADPARDERLLDRLPSGNLESERRLRTAELEPDLEEEAAAPKDGSRLSKAAERAGRGLAGMAPIKAAESCVMRSLPRSVLWEGSWAFASVEAPCRGC